MGGNQLYYLVKRLMNSRSLGDYLTRKKRNDGWVYSEGYVRGKKNNDNEAPHITDKPMLEAENFTEDGILEITIERQKKFAVTQKTNKLVFTPPHLLIREILGKNKFITAYVEDYLVFKHQIIGIYAPWGQKEELKRIENILQRHYKLFKMFLLAFSSRAGIGRSLSTVLKKDFMALPYPEDERVLELSRNEEIILQDMLDYRLEEYQKGEREKVNITEVMPAQLTEFGKTFCHNLNSIYQVDDKQFHPLPPLDGPAYICFRFTYGEKNNQPVIDGSSTNDLTSLLDYEQEAIKYKRVIKTYSPNMVSLIKPKTLRYWLKSIAIRDAVEVMQDLVESGY